MSPGALRSALGLLASGASLSEEQSAAAFGEVMLGDASGVQIAALLMGLRVKGETPSEVAGAARALRRAMTVLDAPDAASLVDTCGTGGGAVATFNISTAAALLVAGAGARVAKHGNRSFTSRSGSADVLEALGVAIDLSVDRMREVLDRAGIVFMFAPTMHPAMRHVGPVRRELAIPTLMNLVGPLANPAAAGRQVIGVADPARHELMARALAALGTGHSLVVHGAPGMDEVSPLGPTVVYECRGHELQRWEIDPDTLGLRTRDAADLAGGEPAENAALIVDVLEGRGRAGARAAVLLNAAAAACVAGLADGMHESLALVRAALDDGAGLAALNRLREAAPHQ